MKTHRPLAFLAAFFVAAVLCAPSAHAQFGVVGGLNYNSVSDIEVGTNDVSFDNTAGWHVGLWLDFPFGQLALRPEIRYMDAGDLYEEGDIEGVQDDFDLSLIEVPVHLRYRFPTPTIKPYVMAGPVVRFPTDAGDELDDDLSDFSIAGSIGGGLEFILGPVRLFPEVAYTFGISNLVDDFDVQDVNVETDDSQRLNGFLVRLGIGF